MNIEVKTWLYDILKAIEETESFMADIPNDFSSFQNSLKTKRAVERNIEMIGKAMNRVLNVDDTIPLSNTRKIVDARNRIIHGYDTVSDDIIWGITVRHLPLLKSEIKHLLGAAE